MKWVYREFAGDYWVEDAETGDALLQRVPDGFYGRSDVSPEEMQLIAKLPELMVDLELFVRWGRDPCMIGDELVKEVVDLARKAGMLDD